MAEKLNVAAGALSAVFTAGDLRWIHAGSTEVIRRIYGAVRDRTWGTVPAVLSNLRMDRGERSFRISYDADHRQDGIHFRWSARITGSGDGTILFEMDGRALSTFLRNRIGLCVLHPIQGCAGRPCTVEKVDGSVEQGEFPLRVAAHQPFLDMRAIAHEVAPGVTAEVRFSGDIFEMEDQRNWTDASYKTYSTPLRLPYPAEIKAGTEVKQSVRLALKGTPPPAPAPAPMELRISGRSVPLPPIAAGAPIVPPTSAYFAELNRNRPEPSVIVGACFSVTPQVHAFDDDSLVENLAAQQDAVESARAFLGGRPVHISPVTFRMQSNPEPDPRQASPFGACWTAGSIKYLSQGGAASISYYEATGALRQVFADVAEFAGGEVLISESTRPLEFDGLVLRKGGRMRILLASFSPEPISVRLATDRLGRRAVVGAEPVAISGHWLEIALRPYAIVRIHT